MWTSLLLAFLLPLCKLCLAAPAPFDAKHTHDGNDTRNDKVFENSEIHMGDLTVDTATGDNMHIGHTLDINVVQTHGVQSAEENAEDPQGHTQAPVHSHVEDFEERLSSLFKSMDTDEDGIISVAELVRICNENEIYITELQAQNVLSYPSETVPFSLSYFLAILENASSSSDTVDVIHFLLRSSGSQDHLMFDKNLMHVFLAMDADHDCLIFVPDILSVFQDMGKTISLDEAKSLLSGYHGHDHHDGVDFNLWKKLILGEVFKQDGHLVDYWRDAFIEVKDSFDVELTVDDVMRTDVENAAKTAVKALKNGPELGECYQGDLAKVESATVEVKEGLLYKLQLKISTTGGDDCLESREMICENVLMKKPLPKDCKGADALKLLDREHITCEKVEAAPEVLWTGPSPSQTFELPSLTLVNSENSYCKVADPDMDKFTTSFQKVEGNVYGCNHEECKLYLPEENTWKTIPGTKFLSKRKYSAGTLVGDKWVVQGGDVDDGDHTRHQTAEVWAPGDEDWVEDAEFESPIPISRHCLVTINNKLMQIGGHSLSGASRTNRCFLDGEDVASLNLGRAFHACTVFQGQVWVAGGTVDTVDGGPHNGAVVEIYDPDTNTWRDDGPKLPVEENNIMTDWYPQLVENSGQLYYIGGDEVGKIYKLNQNMDAWEEVGDIETGEKFAAILMKKSANCVL